MTEFKSLSCFEYFKGSSSFGNISDRNILDQQKILIEEMLQPIPTKFSFLEKCLSANFSENFASDYTNLINVTQVSILFPFQHH